MAIVENLSDNEVMSDNMIQARVVVTGERAGIVYASESRAREMADDLNKSLPGHGKHEAFLSVDGWSIRRTR